MEFSYTTQSLAITGTTTFLSAVVVRSFIEIPRELMWLVFIIAVALLFLWLLVREPVLAYVVVTSFSLVVGLLRYEMVDDGQVVTLYEQVYTVEQELIVRVVSEPDVRENYARYVVSVSHEDAPEDIRALLYVPTYSYYEYGEVLRVTGALEPVENFTEEFNWKQYLSKDEIYGQLFSPEVKRINTFDGGYIQRGLFGIKRELLSSVSRILPEPHAALAGGLVFGGKRSLPREVLDDFRVAGLIHIVVLSGYNITIVAVALMALLSRFKLRTRISLGAVAMIAFGIMVGGGPTVVRSVLMALLALLARALGREYQVGRALIAALVLMVFWSPKVLIFDTGFQLSFVATAGLIYGRANY